MNREQIQEASQLDEAHTMVDAQIDALLQKRKGIRNRMEELGIAFNDPVPILQAAE